MEEYEMERCSMKGFSARAIIVACLILSTILWSKEEFQARLIMESGPGPGKPMKINIVVESYTSAEEVFQLMDIQEKSGYEPFMSAFRAMDKGSFNPVARGLKIPINAAQNIQTEKGRQILLFAERQSWDMDVRQRIDTRFTFMVIELNLDNKGTGTGKMYEQARIRLTSQGTIEMESYGSPPRQIFGVKAIK
jgi:hypothetical protein